MSYFGQRAKPKLERVRDQHHKLATVVAEYIATIESAQDQADAIEAFTMYMSIKIGDTKREIIKDGYMHLLAEAGVKLD